MTPFTRAHHTSRRFNNVARLKMANHHPVIATNSSSADPNNNSNNNAAILAHYEHGHADSLLEALNDLRISRHLCDITIVVDQHQYPCHKVAKIFSWSSLHWLLLCRIFSRLPVHTFVQCSLPRRCVNRLNPVWRSTESIRMPCPNWSNMPTHVNLIPTPFSHSSSFGLFSGNHHLWK